MKDYSGYIADIDGVISRGDEVIRPAINAINSVKAGHKKFVFITNNSTRLPSEYRERLTKMGIRDVQEADIITSGTVTANYLKRLLTSEHGKNKAFCVAADAVKTLLKNAGFEILGLDGEEYMKADYVVAGEPKLMTHEGRRYLSFDDLNAAVNAIKHGNARFIATNPDTTDPMPGGRSKPVAGSIIAYIQACTGAKPTILGKPRPQMYKDALEAIGLPAKKVLVIGDRLDTDIKGALDLGIDAALVLTGAHTRDDVKRLGIKPTYVLNDLSGIKAA
ncbi:MAG: HAD-IIA family hydrolase [Candidatus Altiarchaeota archaeon]|nr:HAD-IIA family hydrolase [Candidatus Altiarchaeota archaeon]